MHNSVPFGKIFMKFDTVSIFRKSVEKSRAALNMTIIMGDLHDYVSTFIAISR